MFQRLFSFLFIFSLISFSPLFAQDDLIKEIDALNDNPDVLRVRIDRLLLRVQVILKIFQ